jgi:hypothetical protein
MMAGGNRKTWREAAKRGTTLVTLGLRLKANRKEEMKRKY